VQAATNKHFYVPGEPITVTATMLVLNDEARVGVTRDRRSNLSFELDIVDERGQPVQRTEAGIAVLNIKPDLTSVIVSSDKPFQESYRIDTWFELSEPGVYTLTVRNTTVRVSQAGTMIGFAEVIGDPVVFTRLPEKPDH
jgi:hypothetical protein